MIHKKKIQRILLKEMKNVCKIYLFLLKIVPDTTYHLDWFFVFNYFT